MSRDITLLAVVVLSFRAAGALRLWSPLIASRSCLAAVPLEAYNVDLVQKDLSLFAAVAERAGVRLELSPVLIDIFDDAAARYGTPPGMVAQRGQALRSAAKDSFGGGHRRVGPRAGLPRSDDRRRARAARPRNRRKPRLAEGAFGSQALQSLSRSRGGVRRHAPPHRPRRDYGDRVHRRLRWGEPRGSAGRLERGGSWRRRRRRHGREMTLRLCWPTVGAIDGVVGLRPST